MNNMQFLTLYFNEICLVDSHPANLDKSIDDFMDVMESVIALRLEMQSDCVFGFLSDSLHADCWGRPLISRLSSHAQSKKDRWRRIQSRIKPLDFLPGSLPIEVNFQGHVAKGMTLAALCANVSQKSWVLSIIAQQKLWAQLKIEVDYSILDENANIHIGKCEIGNLSQPKHIDQWKDDLLDWGASPNESSVLDHLEGRPIVMYLAPLEHNPPHIHLLESRSGNQTYAKYRIDDGVREKGKPTFDAQMKEWINTYKDQLLRSWHRCQRELHPFELKKVEKRKTN